MQETILIPHETISIAWLDGKQKQLTGNATLCVEETKIGERREGWGCVEDSERHTSTNYQAPPQQTTTGPDAVGKRRRVLRESAPTPRMRLVPFQCFFLVAAG